MSAPILSNRQLLIVGAGAVTGVLAFNLLTAPLGTVPFAGGALEAVPQDVMLGSRMVAVATAGAGALAGTWLYDQWTGGQSDFGLLGALLGGAAVGVAAGSYLMAGSIGTLPVSATNEVVGTMATSAAQAASRVYVVGCGVVGSLVGGWLYGR